MKRIKQYIIPLVASALLGSFIMALSDPVLPDFNQVSEKQKIMETLGEYTGTWKSEMKKNQQNGTEFYYTYQLTFFDENKSILKMTITRHFTGGKEQLLWEGYKGWNSAQKKAYYYGFSPSGRYSTGTVYVKNDNLITEYTGFAPTGEPVKLIDTFFPVENGTFKSVTDLKPKGGEWRTISRDTWTKM